MLDSPRTQLVSVHHKRLLALCDALEAIADDLPNRVDMQQCLLLAQALGPLLADAQRHEESEIFPALPTLEPLRPQLCGIIDQLCFNHQLDLSYAGDVEDMLRSYGEGRRTVSANTAGFMLRGFFEGLRRHIAFEEHLVLPLMHLVERQAVRLALAG